MKNLLCVRGLMANKLIQQSKHLNFFGKEREREREAIRSSIFPRKKERELMDRWTNRLTDRWDKKRIFLPKLHFSTPFLSWLIRTEQNPPQTQTKYREREKIFRFFAVSEIECKQKTFRWNIENKLFLRVIWQICDENKVTKCCPPSNSMTCENDCF